MPHKPPAHEWALSMIIISVLFRCVGTSKPEKYKVAVNRNISIAGFMEHLKASRSITGKLLLNGKELKEDNRDATLHSYGITNGTQLSVRSFKHVKKPCHPIRVNVIDEELQEPLPVIIMVLPSTKFIEMAHVVQDECGMPVEEQVWYRTGKMLKMSRYKNSLAVDHYDHMAKEPLVVKWLPKVQAPVQAGNSHADTLL